MTREIVDLIEELIRETVSYRESLLAHEDACDSQLEIIRIKEKLYAAIEATKPSHPGSPLTNP